VLRPCRYDIEVGMVDIAEPDVVTGVEGFVGEATGRPLDVTGNFPTR
jgi:hypothetical protein